MIVSYRRQKSCRYMLIKGKEDLLVLKRLGQYIKKYTFFFVLGILGNAIYAISDASFASLTSPFVNSLQEIASNPDTASLESYRTLTLAPFIVIAYFLIRGTGIFLATKYIGFVGRFVIRDFRCEVLNHINKLPVLFFTNNSSGDLIAKVNYDSEQVANAMSGSASGLIRGILTIISMTFVMFKTNWKVAILIFAVAPALFYTFNFISKKMRMYSSLIQKTIGDITSVAEEIVEGRGVIRSYNKHEFEADRVAKVANENLRQEKRMINVSALGTPILQVLCSLVMAVFIWVVTLSPISWGFRLNAGDIMQLMMLMFSMLRPIKQVSEVNSTIQRGIAAASSIFKLLDEKVETDRIHAESISKVKGNISIKDVCFVYPDRKEMAIKNLSLDISQGEVVAIVGRSGSGKSTLASMLLRFVNPVSGAIYLDGKDIQNIKLNSLRDQFALVSQNTVLFNDTIANNIAYGANHKLTMQEIERAARLANALEFIQQLPMGFDTIVGSNGVALSGGQRQRISIARAIIKDAPILILDEATSSLDRDSEFHIQKAIDTLKKDRTTLIIAHRLSTIEKADKIVLMNDGEIIGVGTHSDLLHENLSYQMLFKPGSQGSLINYETIIQSSS